MLFLSTMCSCMQYQQSNVTHPNSLQGRVDRMSGACAYVMGMTKEQCIVELGFPTKIKDFNNITVFDYFDDHNGYGHDQYEITFRDDRAVNWKVNARGW